VVLRGEVDKFMCGKMRVRYVIIWVEDDARVVGYVEVDAPVVVSIFVIIFHVLVIVIVVAIVGYWLLAPGWVVSEWLTDHVVCFVVVDYDGLGLLAVGVARVLPGAATTCGIHIAFNTGEDGRMGKEERRGEVSEFVVRYGTLPVKGAECILCLFACLLDWVCGRGRCEFKSEERIVDLASLTDIN